MNQKNQKGFLVFIGVLIGVVLGAALTIGGYAALRGALHLPVTIPGLKKDSAINAESTQKLRDLEDRKSTRLNSSHPTTSRMPSSA